MSHCGTQLVSLEQAEKWNAWIPSRAAKKVGRPFLRGRPSRGQYVVLLDVTYCGSTFLRPEATGGGAPEGSAAGALASRTMI
jgi:hypothetical protein